jgi:MFS family permease
VGHAVWQYLAVLLFSGLGGLIPGTLFGLAVALAPGQDSVSTTVGWMQQWSSLGQFLGPPVVAWVAMQVGGWQWTWLVTGACSVLGLWLALQLQRAWARQRSLSAG